MTPTVPLLSLGEWNSFEQLQSMLNTFPDPIFIKDRQHRWVVCNQALCDLLGKPYEAVLGRSDPDFLAPEEVEIFWQRDDEVFAGVPSTNEEVLTSTDGTIRTIWTRKFPMRNSAGQIIGLCSMITDITDLKRRQAEIERLEASLEEKAAIIAGQNALLEQLSVPVIQIWEGVLLVPLVGAIDSRRAAQVMENLLESIGREGAEIVIIDITGVPMVDTSVASHLVRAVQAAQLLGCQSVMVGISPEIAQTLVGLGIDFSRITTRASLQNGLEYAFSFLSYSVKRKASVAVS